MKLLVTVRSCYSLSAVPGVGLLNPLKPGRYSLKQADIL
jgi:hypothetical protein